jgi:hypothetical protein
MSGWGARVLHFKRHHLLPLHPQPRDPQLHHVADLQIDRHRLHAEADARRRAGGDHVARLQHEKLRAIPDQIRHIEHHGGGRAALALLAVDVGVHGELLRVLDLVLGDQPRPQRPETLGALALADGLPVLHLEGALRHVVGDAIAGDRVHRLVLGEIARALADDDAELAFVIELAAALRHHGVVVRPADAARRLVEHHRLVRHRHARLGGVVGIVEPDGDEIAHGADAGAEPRLAGDHFQPLDIRFADLGEAAGFQHLAVDVFDDARQVADLAVGVEDAGLLAAGRAIADELHLGSPSGVCCVSLAPAPFGSIHTPLIPAPACAGAGSSGNPGLKSMSPRFIALGPHRKSA